jgi:hypothetical protein
MAKPVTFSDSNPWASVWTAVQKHKKASKRKTGGGGSGRKGTNGGKPGGS